MLLSLLAAQVATASIGFAVASVIAPRTNAATCSAIASAISSASAVYYPGSTQYAADIDHWLPNSVQSATCSVEPGSTADVQAIMNILKSTTTPFAIKSGGHTFNQGFSSTTGVHIALSRLNGVTYNSGANTVTLGMGGIWTNVYAALQPLGVTVSGGRIDGVGVGGYLLGGGYSYLSSESGLSMDNVISFEVVLPNATVVTASNTVHQDLFWGLKGGFNNFGIVTSAVVNAFPLGTVYGGELVYSGTSLALLPAALESYSAMQAGSSPVVKGGIILAYKVAPGSAPAAILQVFYNGASPPSNFLAAFNGIPYDSSSLGTYTYTGLIAVVSTIFSNPTDLRAASTTSSIFEITADVVSSYMDIIDDLGSSFTGANSAVIVFEPFVPNSILRPDTEGVFPHSVYASPLNAALWWTDPADDAAGHAALDATVEEFETVLRNAGQPVDDMMLYPNYAGASYTMAELYGPNLVQAKALRAEIDPQGVMLRTGGWKFV